MVGRGGRGAGGRGSNWKPESHERGGGGAASVCRCRESATGVQRSRARATEREMLSIFTAGNACQWSFNQIRRSALNCPFTEPSSNVLADVPLSTHVKHKLPSRGFNKGPNAARVLHQGHLASANSTSPAKTGTGTIGLAVAGDAIKRGRFIDHGFRLRCSVGRYCKAVLRAQRSIDRTHHLLSFAASNSISTYPLLEDRTVDPPPGN